MRKVVLIVDNSVSWNTQLPPAETVAWQRLEKLLLSIKAAKRKHAIRLECVQIPQSALAKRIRHELAVHEEAKKELAGTGVIVVDEKNDCLWL